VDDPAGAASPVSPEFSQVLAASPEDVDELGHISNIAYVRWIQEVAKAHSRAVGWDHEAYRRLGAVFVVRRHEIDYLAPVYAGESIRLTTWIRSFSAATCVRATEIAKVEGARPVARGTTLWALVSIESGRPRRIPPEIQEAFARPVPPGPG
jgi:acyl-CoA thioester hydrolase